MRRLVACHFFRYNSLQSKNLSRQNDQQKLGAKPFDSCQHHWTKMDNMCVALAPQLYEAASH
jgi:hypothetical protein